MFLPFTEIICQMCGIPLPFAENSCEQSIARCGRCLTKTFPFRQIIPCCWYQDPIQTLIHDYKFKEKLFLAPILARLMIQKIETHYTIHSQPECLIPLPLHAKRLRERGYHQVHELTKILAKHFSIPIELNICQRIKHSLPQSLVPFKSRKENVKKVFSAKKISYQHVAIIDDVVTTGETVTSLCRVLKKANPALIIDVWCLARTKPRK